ncbi:MAG TPA: hypothetical protein VK742_02170, partial [Candidatus Sulfotelmatobacter sp.]|nr:hypothetical protein [Candidatus Sulfotelmatobacter sp.]
LDKLIVAVHGIYCHANRQLPQVTETLCTFCPLLGAGQCRQQHGGKNGDNGNNHQQLDQREPAFIEAFNRSGTMPALTLARRFLRDGAGNYILYFHLFNRRFPLGPKLISFAGFNFLKLTNNLYIRRNSMVVRTA